MRFEINIGCDTHALDLSGSPDRTVVSSSHLYVGMSNVATLVSSGQQLPRSEWPSITEFYTDRDVFITGATGFMGKCLVEKILRSVPGEGRVFVLVRSKKGKSAKERMEDLTGTKVRDISFLILLLL